jgi:Family of unknown function (DUF5636)
MDCDLGKNCKWGTEWAEPSQWGFPISCCEYHFEEELKKLAEKMPGRINTKDTFLRDYTKLYLLMTTRKGQEEVLSRLEKLGGHMGKRRVQRKREQVAEITYVKLSVILQEYEAMAWFPPSNEVFLGFLPGFNFQNSIAKGIMAKDPGAGVNHGDFTHRLQWHAIISVITGEFTKTKLAGWTHTPIELYTNLGSATFQAGNLWFRLFDDASQPDFRSPDILHAEVRNSDRFGPLHLAVKKRHDKRLKEYKAQLADSEEPTSKTIHTHPHLTDLITPDPKVSAAAGVAYAKRKVPDSRQQQLVGLKWAPVWKPKQEKGFEPLLTIKARIESSKLALNNLNHSYSPVLGPVLQPGKTEWVVDL